MTSRSVPVQLDRLRHLLFPFNAIADVQDVDSGIWRKPISQPQVLRRLMWAGLKDEDPTLTESKVGILVERYMEDGGSLEDLVKKVDEALGASVYLEQLNKRADASGSAEADPPKNSDGPGSKQ